MLGKAAMISNISNSGFAAGGSQLGSSDGLTLVGYSDEITVHVY